jgi:putative flippase GtrA
MLKGLVDHLRGHGPVLMKFGVVGVLATLVHVSVALAALSVLHQPLLANLCGFLAAFGVSFLGHAIWTFQLAEGRWRAARRFFVVSGCSFLFSTVVLAACVASGLLPPPVSLLVSIVVIPICNYVAARVWAFAKPSFPSSSPHEV